MMFASWDNGANKANFTNLPARGAGLDERRFDAYRRS